MQRRRASSWRSKMGTCQLRKKTQTEEHRSSRTAGSWPKSDKEGQGPHRPVEQMMMMMMICVKLETKGSYAPNSLQVTNLTLFKATYTHLMHNAILYPTMGRIKRGRYFMSLLGSLNWQQVRWWEEFICETLHSIYSICTIILEPR
jgi:hypothetical protein